MWRLHKQTNPINHIELFKDQPLQFVLWELVPNWYKSFLTDHFDQAEMMNDSIILCNNTSIA